MRSGDLVPIFRQISSKSRFVPVCGDVMHVSVEPDFSFMKAGGEKKFRVVVRTQFGGGIFAGLHMLSLSVKNSGKNDGI